MHTYIPLEKVCRHIHSYLLVTVLDPILRIPCDVYVYLAGTLLTYIATKGKPYSSLGP